MSSTRQRCASAATAIIVSLAIPLSTSRGADSVTVHLSVDATESFGNPLSYDWRTTDGRIVAQDSATADWTLPNGPGIHFAYVLVSNGKGGYTEGRIAVKTDDNPTNDLVARENDYPAATNKIFNVAGASFFQSPDFPDPKQIDDGTGTIKGQLLLDDGSECGKRVPFFGVEATGRVELRDKDDQVVSDTVLNPYGFGEFTLADARSGTQLVAICEGSTATFTEFSRDPIFPSNPLNVFILRGTGQPQVNSMSAIQNGKSVGVFPVPPTPPAGTLPSDYFGRQDNHANFTPPFLSFKGLDTRKGACEYYKAIGAVADCDAAGNFQGAVLNFTDWRRSVRIGEFKATMGFQPDEFSAVFINATDLNLTRDHHSIDYRGDSLGHEQLAAYVCNHPGAASDQMADPTGLFPTEPDINAAIDKVLNIDDAHPQGRDLVACVAMDRSSDLIDVNGENTRNHGLPFTRFLIFGPNGDLLPSVNLDGNGEKFVPGTCVACHGGSLYFALANNTDSEPDPAQRILGGYPETGQAPDLGAYFLPYDVGNFLFSTKHPHTLDDQQSAIFSLNDNARLVDKDIAVDNWRTDPDFGNVIAKVFDDLIKRWYPQDALEFDFNAGPPPAYGDDTDHFYSAVVARSCRTCHIAMDLANFERFDPKVFNLANLVCGQAAQNLQIPETPASYVMPNAQVTFDRFWLSELDNVQGQPSNIMHQPEILRAHAGFMVSDCKNPRN